MGLFGFHTFGSFLLFVASILLLVATITAPVINDIALAKAKFTIGGTSANINLGVLGYCVMSNLDGGADACSSTGTGYNLPPIIVSLAEATGTISDSTESAIHAVTTALVLHPVACGVSFLAFIIAGCSDRLGYLFAALVAAFAAIIALICMILDLVLFYVVKKYLQHNNLPVDISYSTGTWLTVAAFACLFVGVFATACACITDRRHRRRSEKW
ncbi:hypothetical protein JCM11641_003077 [Rhodosporidiobolus odoratus]